MARHHRLRHQASQQAAAAAAPQRHAIHRSIHASRRDERKALRSIKSMNTAIQDSIDAAQHDIRHTSGLLPQDKASALATLATSRVSAAAGASFEAQQARQDAAAIRHDLRTSLVDLSAQQGATAQSALADLLQARKDRQATVAADQASRHFDARQAKLDRRAAAKPTPTQQRNASASAAAAGIIAKRLFQEHGIPSTAADWAAFERLVASSKGVDDPADAHAVVKKLRKVSAAAWVATQAAGAGGAAVPNNFAPPASYGQIGAP